jgi:hypothetical protein
MGEAVRHPELCAWPREVERLQLELASVEMLLLVHNPCDQARHAALRQQARAISAQIEAMKAAQLAREFAE